MVLQPPALVLSVQPVRPWPPHLAAFRPSPAARQITKETDQSCGIDRRAADEQQKCRRPPI